MRQTNKRKDVYMSKVNQLGQYKGIEFDVKKTEVTDAELDQQIQAILSQNNQLEDKDGEVVQGDITTIDFEGFKDGIAFDGGKAEGFQLEIGSGQFIPGFEDQMIGMTKGETRELNLTFPENYGSVELAGADVIFKVTVHNIQVKKEAVLNDEFVASLNNPEMKTVEDLKAMVKASLQQQHDQEYMREKENVIFEQLIKSSDVEVDDVDVKKALDQHILHISNELASQGMQLEQYLQMMGTNEEVFREQLMPSAKNQAVFEAIIDEVINVENITTSDDEVNAQIKAIAEANQMTEDQVKEKIDPTALKHDFNRMKAAQLIIENAVEN
jgi:trigger factor